eukprot:COSAG02_NODE_394_length_23152_cov_13.232204_9_plen_815_part_00
MPEPQPPNRMLWDGGAVVAEDGDAAAERSVVEEPVGRRRLRRPSRSAPELTVEEARAELQQLERRLLDLEPASGGTTYQWKVNRLTSKLKRVQAAATPPPWYSCPRIEDHSGTLPKDTDRLPGGRHARKRRAKRQAAKRDQLASLSLERVDMAALQSEWLAGLDVVAMQRISPKDSAIGAWIAQHSKEETSDPSNVEALGGPNDVSSSASRSAALAGRARALHDWNVAAGAAADDLHFNANDELTIVSNEPGQGWLTGSIPDSASGAAKVGIFPANFVEILLPLPGNMSKSKQRQKEQRRLARKQRQDKLAQPKPRLRSPKAHGPGMGGSSVDVTENVSMCEILGSMQGDEPGWRGACMCVSLRRPDGGWHEKGWREVAAVEGTVQGTAAAAGVVPPSDGAFRVHALGPNAGLGAVFTIADDPIGYNDEASEDPRTEAVCGVVAVHPRSFAAIAGVTPEHVVVAINGKLCADAASGGMVMSRRAAILAMMDEAIHSGDDHVQLHLATPERWRNVVRPLLREEFGGVKKKQREGPLFYEIGGCGGGVRVHPLYWSLGPEDMCVTVEYTALNKVGQPVDGHLTGAELQSTSEFYLAAVQLREAMGQSFGINTPGGSPELPVSLIPAVGISTGRRSQTGIFEVQLAKRWGAGLELYAIASQSQSSEPVGWGSMVSAKAESGVDASDDSKHQSSEASGPARAVIYPHEVQKGSTKAHQSLSFSLPSDTESAIVTKVGETLGFWVAGDDVNYDTFGASDSVTPLRNAVRELACGRSRTPVVAVAVTVAVVAVADTPCICDLRASRYHCKGDNCLARWCL